MLPKKNPADDQEIESCNRPDEYQRNLIKMYPNEHFMG
jgi:hypothetical protein